MAKTEYTAEYLIEALRQLDQGKSVGEVAPVFGMDTSTLYRAKKKAEQGRFPGFTFTRTDVVRKHRRFSKQDKIAAVRRVEAGETPADVARDLGIEDSMICRWFSEYGDPKLAPVKKLGRAEAENVVVALQTKEAEERLAEAEAQRREKRQLLDRQERIGGMVADPLIWMQRHTETKDSHWRENGAESPYRRFPDLPYFRPLVEDFEREPIMFIEKSRNMLLSWLFVGLFTHAAMTTNGIEILFQSQKQEKAFELVEYAKVLYDRQKPELKEAFPLVKDLKTMADGELLFADGSRIIGIPGGADQIRSYHPWGLLMDEAAFMPEAEGCYNNAVPVCKKIIVLSSAGPGWFADTVTDTV